MSIEVVAVRHPRIAFRAATFSAAELLGREKDIGTIEVVKVADIVAVEDNLWKNIRALEAVKVVMKSGGERTSPEDRFLRAASPGVAPVTASAVSRPNTSVATHD